MTSLCCTGLSSNYRERECESSEKDHVVKPYQGVQLHSLVCSSTILILGGILAYPEVHIVQQLLKTWNTPTVQQLEATFLFTTLHSHLSPSPCRYSEGYRSLHCKILHIDQWARLSPAQTCNDCRDATQSNAFTLNLTILHIFMPTFCPAPLQATSVSAEAFLT